MKIMLTLDYEVFFGQSTGSVHDCLIYPTQKIIEILDLYNAKACFFVDAGFLERLSQFKKDYPQLEADYQMVTEQIRQLIKRGHDIQLHIHPHWEDCCYEGGRWEMDTTRYRLHDFTKSDVERIISRYKNTLENVIENDVKVYRAGGWCLLPFDHINSALMNNGILIDSTVFRNGEYSSASHSFDFSGAEDKTIWRFSDDPLTEDPTGKFTEVPISSFKASPLFFWGLAFAKKFGGNKHKSIGKGSAVKANKKELLKMLTNYTYSVVSMDGYKAKYLAKSLKNYRKKFTNDDYFVVIGHPKSATHYSLEQLEKFVKSAVTENKFTTYRQEIENGSIRL